MTEALSLRVGAFQMSIIIIMIRTQRLGKRVSEGTHRLGESDWGTQRLGDRVTEGHRDWGTE